MNAVTDEVVEKILSKQKRLSDDQKALLRKLLAHYKGAGSRARRYRRGKDCGR